jgi:hypothetical protein
MSDRSRFRSILRALVPGALMIGLALTPLSAQEDRSKRRWEHDILRDTFGFDAQTPTDAPWSELVQGCSRRDCIPAIDKPVYIGAAEAKFLADGDLVLAVETGNGGRAYPTFILDLHEIVNDVVDGEPVAITWCPLCGSGLGFKRTLDGEAVEFGVSGMLRENDLVLYDRKTESLWQQITATSFAGPMRGRRLETHPLTVTTWGRWKSAHPDTEVLSKRTGHLRDYRQKQHYGDYAESERLLFPVSRRNKTLHPKTVVYGVELGSSAVAFLERELREPGVRTVQSGGSELTVTTDAAGGVGVARTADGVRQPVHRMFWFAWYTFHPETSLHRFTEAAAD